MRALLSILTLYNADNTVFDNLQLPTGVEKDDVTNNLLMELSELEVIYTSPDMMKAAIGFWSKKELPIWQKLYDTTKFDYQPLENLYRHEEYTDDETRNLSGSNNETRALAGSNNETRNLEGTNNETRDLTGTNNETKDLAATDNETRDLAGTGTHHSTTSGTTTNNGTDTTKEYVSGFNETTPTLAKQTEQTLGTGNTVGGTVETTDGSTDKGTDNHSKTETGTDNTSTTDKGTVNHALSDTGTVNTTTSDTGTVNRALTDTGTVSRKNTAYMHGSIGVITPQQMIEQERRVDKFNIVDYIIDSFKGRFCIMVY
jgi:hypothetical protein